MGFSEKMRDSLGAEGARLEVQSPTAAIEPGTTAATTVVIIGGSKPAAVDALVVRLLDSHRHWIDATGATISEADARTANQSRSDAEHGEAVELVPNWTKTALGEQRIAVGTTVEAGQRH